MSDLERIVREIRKNHSFLLMAHTNPDADAIGASLGLALALRKIGKTAVYYSQDAMPKNLSFLPGIESAVKHVDDLSHFDAIVALDCGDMHRAGRIEERIKDFPKIINLDHHASNPNFGHMNLVDENASSSSEIVYRVLKAGGFDVDSEVATCLYTGIYYDTGSFRNSNSSPASYRIAGEMVAAGADPVMIARNLFVVQSASKALLFSLIAPTLAIEPGGKIAGMTVTLEMMKRAKVGPDAVEGFVEFPMSIEGIQASYLVREVHAPGGAKRVKGSLRTTDKIDAVEVAALFGGGGHRRASGFTADGEIEDIRRQLLSHLKKRLSPN